MANASQTNKNRAVVCAKVVGASATPAIAGGTGAGTGATLAVAGSDLAGVITITPSGSPATSATVATITFAAPFDTAPRSVTLTPCNAAAAALSGNSAVYADSASTTTAVFLLKSGSSAIASGTAYAWAYAVIG